ncbi:NUDIX hydrolase [Streptomyces sp. CC224B]|uniref:NUDIX hydrolase n=1 Tax=Streptomyces sp. CC224B TaxID=3044571 RepID=UPI0024A9D84A|nr:NUDIX hydrolase [Streptomyces sp. CC224B]
MTAALPEPEPEPEPRPKSEPKPEPKPEPEPESEPVLAAGCLLWRRSTAPGGLELCLVHRPKYDDWSWPKGKLQPGETLLACALREVEEETGHRCVPGPALPTVRYLSNGRPKEVHYWAAESAGGHFTPSSEVDRVRWLPPDETRARLTRLRDSDLVPVLLDALRGAGAL